MDNTLTGGLDLTVAEDLYFDEWREWWRDGGREPHLADFDGLVTVDRAAMIQRTIRRMFPPTTRRAA